MLKLILSMLAGSLAVMNRGNEALATYWTFVCLYWILNYIDGRKTA